MRGTRLPDDWTPSPELIAKLRRELSVDPLVSLETFKNHWLSKSGPNATKVRWDLTFHEWVKRDLREGRLQPLPPIEDAPQSYGPPALPPPGLLERMRKLAEPSNPIIRAADPALRAADAAQNETLPKASGGDE